MKFDRQKSFPHPVLRPDSSDYIDVDFQADANLVVTPDTVKFEVFFMLSSDYLLEMVRSNKASYVVSVSCSETMSRYTASSSLDEHTLEVPKAAIRGRVDVSHFIVANEALEMSSEEFNEEYGGVSFNVSKGDVLAQDETISYYIEREAFEKVSSGVELVIDATIADYEWRVALDDHRIKICVNAKLKKKLEVARNNSRNKSILLNSLYFSTLTHAVQALQGENGEENEYSDYRWAQTMKKQANNLGLDIENDEPYIIVQTLLHRPIAVLSGVFFDGDR